ncbi:MAG: stage II sporulation protein R [Oscillospiraceae bacterium]|nr:stage II sporulation protein R [Oscillospiraceae bacterium]
MKKTAKFLWCVVFVVTLGVVGALIADMQYLQENVVRLHVRANSDSAEDQLEKLAVRDELLSYLSMPATEFKTAQDAKAYLQENLHEYEDRINSYLLEQGSSHQAKLIMRREAFDTRNYESFRLPAGIYDSLVVQIGSGVGQNWWCVVFPSLCLQDFYTAAAAVDMDTDMQNTLTGGNGYQVRFFLLECLGKLENFFYKS